MWLSRSVKAATSDGQISSFKRVCKFVPKKCESSFGQGIYLNLDFSTFFQM